MRIACWIPKAPNTNSEYVRRIALTAATLFARTHNIVTLYVYCPPCSEQFRPLQGQLRPRLTYLWVLKIKQSYLLLQNLNSLKQ